MTKAPGSLGSITRTPSEGKKTTGTSNSRFAKPPLITGGFLPDENNFGHSNQSTGEEPSDLVKHIDQCEREYDAEGQEHDEGLEFFRSCSLISSGRIVFKA